jgi:hypothetical protein
MKNIIIGIILSSIYCFAFAEIEVDLGGIYLIPAPIGNWYQRDMPYTLRTASFTGSIGIYGEIAESWKIGGGFGYGGRATSDAMIHDVDNCKTNCGQISHMQGQGTLPYEFLMARKTFGKWFTEGGLIVYRPNYENTNFNWYNWQIGTGPVVSHIDHQVKDTVGVGADVGYNFSDSWAVVLKLLPTKSTNPNITEGISGNYYRPIYSSAIGYAPAMTVRYSF